ncbi:Mobile element protein [Streptococcus oralis]|uniref:Mobile element protein n=1 Tax=Streptococcus oralis TaxID=1303 RepID=A0A139PG96_STROR|nr:Mobile element protein [Streptococcus oralis]
MRILSISSIVCRSRGYCTKHRFMNIEENILDRDFTADVLNQKWCTNVTFM